MNVNEIPENVFKKAISNGEVQIGLWLTTTTSYVAEIAATAGYDWLLIDGEHAPNTLTDFYGQLQAIRPYNSHPIIRLPEGNRTAIKQVLDIGAQTLLIPMVETAEQARELYLSMCYAPKGYRGVGASVGRASFWNRTADYMQTAEENLCLLVQVESPQGVENLEAIAQVEGVDGVFIGPADLSTIMGYSGDSTVPEVQEIVKNSIKKIRELGKAAGIIDVDPKMAKQYIEWGANFVAVAVDTLLLTKAMDDNLAVFKPSKQRVQGKKSGY